MARVVEVSDQQSVVSKEVVDNLGKNQPSESEVGVRLTDGSILIFEPLEVKDGELLGQSSIYGQVAVPVDSVEHFYFGDTSESLRTPFEAWVVRPAKEPAFGEKADSE